MQVHSEVLQAEVFHLLHEVIHMVCGALDRILGAILKPEELGIHPQKIPEIEGHRGALGLT
ncbi:hypothetical protein DC3_55050 [Deinococcus cellulosilyticus NBRC 106333 = KACC 11606]|uniref:Uncharacterized protein n=1 Tax=Deinococcus cellulosilyticus (strain DSM 18568 / NBRC 106333 / KACC 11606 / 5516J-15) TaxID=1223518 RepID=A0A511NAP0_DEIC1|nr:hypothetical protein DC3_55050 [Deinococcus cellulosilyticus NBRC 106333 = KACC 11606]